jgi:mycothiol synthase
MDGEPSTATVHADGGSGSHLIAERHDRRWKISGAVEGLADHELLADLTAFLSRLHDLEAGGFDWWVDPADDRSDRIAATLGFSPDRDIDQLRRTLPLDQPFTITTRPVDLASDADRWIKINNRAFAWHEEQGAWTATDLHERTREPWFDTADFRIHEEDGAMDGFCWTKVHTGTDPLIGEVFVIAVDPDATGRGLGRQLTLAGLDHLARERAVAVGMLYVESDNEAAQALYRKLGFTKHQVNRRYRRG